MVNLDYLLFLAACLPLVAGVIYLMWRARGGRAVSGERIDNGQSPAHVLDTALRKINHRKTMQSRAQVVVPSDFPITRVPTPWGWPEPHGHGKRSKPESLHKFSRGPLRTLNKAVRQDERSRADICIRALLEDRYGRVFDETGTRSFHYDPEKHPRRFHVMKQGGEHEIH